MPGWAKRLPVCDSCRDNLHECACFQPEEHTCCGCPVCWEPPHDHRW